MFQSCALKYLSYSPQTNWKRYTITIVDDTFTETVSCYAAGEAYAVVSVLINIYSQKNLNVASNLALLMQHLERKWASINIKWQIEYYQKYVPGYQKYHDQVMEYLVFL